MHRFPFLYRWLPLFTFLALDAVIVGGWYTLSTRSAVELSATAAVLGRPFHHTSVPVSMPPQTSVAQASGTIHLVAIGDVMVDRYVHTLMQQNGDGYPWTYLDPLLAEHDIAFANLEGPIVDDYARTPDNALRFSFPRSTAALLKTHHLTILSVANNHSLDHGMDGDDTTRAALADAGLDAVGSAAAVDDQYGVTKHINGQTIVFVGYHATGLGIPLDANAAIAQVQRLAANPSHFVVVSVHWGVEYRTTSNAVQQQLAHAFIDAGADLILGHHPHVVEEVEVYQHRAIFYSLGNAIFDQYFSTDTQQELGVDATITPTSVTYTLLPLQSAQSQPQLMTNGREIFLQTLFNRSKMDGVVVQNGTFTLTR